MLTAGRLNNVNFVSAQSLQQSSDYLMDRVGDYVYDTSKEPLGIGGFGAVRILLKYLFNLYNCSNDLDSILSHALPTLPGRSITMLALAG